MVNLPPRFKRNFDYLCKVRYSAKSSSTNALDDMGNRINELEQSINDLKAEMGVEGTSSPLDPSRQKSDEAKQDERSA
ncbi:heat shock factor-binding protein 1-like isoform X2 [Gossypium australe]|uniref:Heat shock factor-binding protein 1-like isoform X2 n=1 Tax=Gossypium australe TaxID=47621 RepID=A0A5B6V1P0_9ROSI|nr:heat shock factor-binding protein 1-like isoform X2 [Gossypium australe]